MKKNLISKKILIFDIAIISILLSLGILFSYLSNFFTLPFAPWLTIDISPFFYIMIYFCIRNVKGVIWTIFSILIGSVFNFIYNPYSGWIGVVINISSNLLFFVIILIFYKLISFLKLKDKIKYIIFNLLSIIVISLLLCLLNGLLFTPLYWYVFDVGNFNSFSYIEIMNWYNSEPNIWLLYIPNYWTGIFGLYSAFNFIKFGIIGVLLISTLFIFNKQITKINSENMKIKNKIIFI